MRGPEANTTNLLDCLALLHSDDPIAAAAFRLAAARLRGDDRTAAQEHAALRRLPHTVPGRPDDAVPEQSAPMLITSPYPHQERLLAVSETVPADSPSRLTEPTRLWSRADVLRGDARVPRAPGVYAWYIANLPPELLTDGCVTYDGYPLVYVGTAPKTPSNAQTLFSRIKTHLMGDASRSTLRLSLGCLLAEQLGLELRRGSHKRLTFGSGEAALSAWLDANARLTWHVTPTPWLLEAALVQRYALPLNLHGNQGSAVYPVLHRLRQAAKARARALPVPVLD